MKIVKKLMKSRKEREIQRIMRERKRISVFLGEQIAILDK